MNLLHARVTLPSCFPRLPWQVPLRAYSGRSRVLVLGADRKHLRFAATTGASPAPQTLVCANVGTRPAYVRLVATADAATQALVPEVRVVAHPV